MHASSINMLQDIYEKRGYGVRPGRIKATLAARGGAVTAGLTFFRAVFRVGPPDWRMLLILWWAVQGLNL
jgi:hypothetical protein